MAQKWAENMTNQFAALAVAEPIFGELRNCMELAIVGALIVKERLPDKAGYSLPVLMTSADLQPAEFNAPKQVPSQASVLPKGTTSGSLAYRAAWRSIPGSSPIIPSKATSRPNSHQSGAFQRFKMVVELRAIPRPFIFRIGRQFNCRPNFF